MTNDDLDPVTPQEEHLPRVCCTATIVQRWLLRVLAPVLLLGIIGAGGCASPSAGIRSDRFSVYLSHKDYCNTPISEIEREMGLGVPSEIHYPYFADPLWWFIYKVEGYTIALSGNWDEEMASGDMRDRDFYFWSGMWKVHRPEDEACAPMRITEKTFDVLEMYCGGSDASAYTNYLRALDKRIGVPVLKVESDLSLGVPAYIEVPAFVNPLWQMHYNVNGYRVELWAREAANEEIDRRNRIAERGKLVFAGYWKVYHLDKDIGGMAGEGPRRESHLYSSLE